MKVLLPAVPHQSVQRKSRTAEINLQGTGTVLVVDDEELVRNTAKATLEHFGYTVLVAENGQLGVDVFRANADQIHAVILDMTMPVMGGEEAFRQIRIIRPDARVIFTSGYNEAETVEKLSAGGSPAFIQKPYAATKLARLVKRMILNMGEAGDGI